MAETLLSAVERSVRKARRRLIGQRLLDGTVAATVSALALGLLWVLAEPWLLSAPADWLKWAVVGGLVGVALIGAAVWAVCTAPTRERTALELDTRFNLKERVTTAMCLRPEEQATSAGLAVLADAQGKVAAVHVSEKFPVRPRWQAALVPAFAALIAVAAVYYHPDTAGDLGAEEAVAKKKDDAAVATKDGEKKPLVPFTKQRPPELDRQTKSKDLEKLEEELNKLMEKWSREPQETQEKKREKVTELTKIEEKVKKFNQEKYEKLAQMEKQLQQLDRLNKDKEFGDGPAKEFNDALSKGDLKKAEDAVEELKKKVKDKKLDKQDLEKLDKQLEKMKDEMQKLAKNKEQEQKLKEMINKAKQEGRDAESLERELDKLKQDMKQAGEGMDRMAERMQKMQNAIKKGEMDELASELDKMSAEMKEMEEDLKDIEDTGEYLQKLKDELKKACKACGECEGDMENAGRKDFGKGRGVASGLRDLDKDVKTNSNEERVRGLFDPRGKKSYGGSTKGPAFTKRADTEMGKEIQQAVQEAPQAVETQRLPRDAQQSVKEYFEKLGGTGDKK